MPKQVRGPVCAFKGCKSAHRFKEPNVSFFRFPSDPERCKLWIEGCNRPDLFTKKIQTLYNSYKVCSKHFRINMFLNDLKNRLQVHACPSGSEMPALQQITGPNQQTNVQFQSDALKNEELARELCTDEVHIKSEFEENHMETNNDNFNIIEGMEQIIESNEIKSEIIQDAWNDLKFHVDFGT